jgi:hypothetical protein
MTTTKPYLNEKRFANQFLRPGTVTVVTGKMGSGMTNFAFRMLESYDPRAVVFTTTHVHQNMSSPDGIRFQYVDRVSELLTDLALAADEEHHPVVFLDSASITFGPKRPMTLRAHQRTREVIYQACVQARAPLLLTGHGYGSPAWVLPEHWHAAVIIKTSLTHLCLPGGQRYRGVPRTRTNYDTRSTPSLLFDIDPSRYLRFFGMVRAGTEYSLSRLGLPNGLP